MWTSEKPTICLPPRFSGDSPIWGCFAESNICYPIQSLINSIFHVALNEIWWEIRSSWKCFPSHCRKRKISSIFHDIECLMTAICLKRKWKASAVVMTNSKRRKILRVENENSWFGINETWMVENFILMLNSWDEKSLKSFKWWDRN